MLKDGGQSITSLTGVSIEHVEFLSFLSRTLILSFCRFVCMPNDQSVGRSVDRSIFWSIGRSFGRSSFDRLVFRSAGRSFGRSLGFFRSIGRSVSR